MNKEADARNHGQHRHRKTIERQRYADVEITHGHPCPQMLIKEGDAAVLLAHEIDHNPRGNQRCQTNRANTDGRGRIFRPATAGKCQQQKAEQREEYC